MATLGNPWATRAVLEKYGFSMQKRFGQNFLIDSQVLNRIIEAAQVNKDDFIIEIGPGIGTLTQYLCEAAGHVTAVEVDRKLIPILEDTLQTYDNVDIINNDILKVDIPALAKERNGGRPVKIVANLPYYITTPIIMSLFESHVPFASITVMVQKEVADRIRSGPGSKEYGALSLAVQYYAKPETAAEVPPSAFMPQPRVGSTVLNLKAHEHPSVSVHDEQLMFAVIRGSFNQRRKTLANGLNNFAGLDYTKEEIAKAISDLGKKPTVRGEELSLEEFARLSDIFDNNRALC